jgi:hypothetical protein
MAKQDPLSEDEKQERARVQRIEQEQLGWKNILATRLRINKAAKEEETFAKELARLGKEEQENAKAYLNVSSKISALEKEIQVQKAKGTTSADRAAKNLERQLRARKADEETLLKTAGGYLRAQEQTASKQKAALQTERDLLKAINKERGIGSRIADLFRTKEQKQQQIDIARARVGGGANPAAGAGGEGNGEAALAAAGPYGAIAAAVMAQIEKLKAPFKALGAEIKNALMAPLQSAAALISGDALGMGGGAVSGAGATSMLDGLQNIAKTIPVLGGLLGGLIGAFKAMVDAVLGVDQANMRVARTMNISKEAAADMRKSFNETAIASDNIVVNSTRMLQSQVEIGNQLGINKQLSDDILVNDVKLRDIAGVEAESRQAIAQSAIITGRNAADITKSVIGQVGAFNKMVGTSFKFSDILSEASKTAGVLGLTFSKYPERIIKAVASVKTMGFELKQLDGLADSFLDFEGSISKEMEAQVLTGKELNLTKAREAALNNDYASLSAEITKNVGSTSEYLNMNRIQQEAIAQSVGMTRDGLADVLKKQDIYSKLGAGDLKTAQEKIALLEKQGQTQAQISALIGKDGYETITQVTTAEKLTEVMERIKKTFVDFLTNSGIFDFITKPERINGFIKGLTERLAGLIQTIGDIIASVLEAIGSVAGFFGGDKDKYTGLAAQVRSGAGSLAGGVLSVSNSLGGTPAQSVGATVQQGAAQQAVAATPAAASGQPYGVMAPQPIIVQSVLDGQTIATSTVNYFPQVYKK